MSYFNFLNLIALVVFVFLGQGNIASAQTKKEQKQEMKKHDHKKHDHQGAKHKDHDHGDQKASVTKQTKDEILIKVNGMVCSFCAQGIKKNFNARAEVKDTEVNLDKMEVSIKLKKGKTLSEKIIKEMVTDAGFKFERVLNE